MMEIDWENLIAVLMIGLGTLGIFVSSIIWISKSKKEKSRGMPSWVVDNPYAAEDVLGHPDLDKIVELKKRA